MAPIPTLPAFRMPAALVAWGFTLRDEAPADEPFLIDLYISTRAEELVQVDYWTDAQKRAFMAQQFAAQRHHYRTAIDGCRFSIIERDGRPVGRLYLQERVMQWHVVDIALLPEQRGAGVGGAMLTALIEAAATEGKGIGIFVERLNPALHLYRRLGFTQLGEAEIYLEMERPPVN